MLYRQPFSAYCNHSRHCHPLLEHVGGQASFSFARSYRCPGPTSVVDGIDIFAHRSGADRRGQRRGDICGSENGITSSQGRSDGFSHALGSASTGFFYARCSSGADRGGRRGGDICGSENGITSSQGQWHPAHSCFPSPSSFFFLSPF